MSPKTPFLRTLGAIGLGVGVWGWSWVVYHAYTFTPSAANYGTSESALLKEDRVVGSRLDLISLGLDDPQLLKKYSARIITIDRPGHGNSERNDKATIKSNVDDVVEVADILGIKSFSILGYLEGGNYAEAASYYIPEKYPGRLQNVAIVSAPAQSQSTWLNNTGRIGDVVYRFGLRVKRLGILSDYYGKYLWDSNVADKPEAATLSKLTQPELLALSHKEGVKKGVEGEFSDAKLLTGQPWEFELSQIKHRPITVFHGEADPNTPTTAATHFCSSVPTSKCVIYPKLGQYVLAEKWEEILQTLTK